jgi:hypothetical protein
MTLVSVSLLRMQSPPDFAARATHRVEEALRLAPVGPERLLLVRRLALGRLPAGGGTDGWNNRAAEALAEQASRAVHGSDPSAPDAGAVWFRSGAEARALLLRELAAGRRPAAWFWRLAAAEWAGADLADWAPVWIAAAERDVPELVALARAVVGVAEAGDLPRLIRALVAASGPIVPRGVLIDPSAHLESRRPASPQPPDAPDRPALDDERRAGAAVARLSRAARLALAAALVELASDPPRAAWLARMALIAAAPEIAFSGPILDRAATALVLKVQDTPASAALPAVPKGPARPPSAQLALRHESSRPPAPLPDAAVASAQGQAEPIPPQALAKPATTPPAQFVTTPSLERFSRFAGVFLLVVPLERMGLSGWLEARPEAAVDGFGRALLAAIARRMGAKDGDPVLEVSSGETPLEWQDHLTAWRVGLDRWLRRTARIRLGEVACRAGWLILHDESLEARYRVRSADIRLRRQALDLDPLWTPWLGLLIRYHYRDEPLR